MWRDDAGARPALRATMVVLLAPDVRAGTVTLGAHVHVRALLPVVLLHGRAIPSLLLTLEPFQPVLSLHDDKHAARCPSQDRKSTRLNSSHSQISYAVFCLK